MSIRTAKLVARLVLGLTFFLMIGSLILSFLSQSASTVIPDAAWERRAIWILGGISTPIIGGLIAMRQPRNPYGWVWLIFGFAFSARLPFAQSYSIYAYYVATRPLPLAEVALLSNGLAWIIGLAMIPFAILLFPNGHLLSPRWRIVALATLVALALACAVGWAQPGESDIGHIPNPLAAQGSLGELIELIITACVFVVFFAIFLSTVSALIRFRFANAVERQQLKWFAYGAVLFVATLISDFVIELPGAWENVKEALMLNILPVAVGIAILRYRLFDIDIIIRRTLIYSILTGLLAVVYFGGIVLLQQIFRTLTGESSDLAIVISTLSIAALFLPFRRRVQDAIDRRFYRRKYDAIRTLAEFGQTEAMKRISID